MARSIQKYVFPGVAEKISWFPGHMYRALNLMKEESWKAEMFVEIRDARLPLSCKNEEFDQIIKKYSKKKIIIFNKYDLCN